MHCTGLGHLIVEGNNVFTISFRRLYHSWVCYYKAAITVIRFALTDEADYIITMPLRV